VKRPSPPAWSAVSRSRRASSRSASRWDAVHGRVALGERRHDDLACAPRLCVDEAKKPGEARDEERAPKRADVRCHRHQARIADPTGDDRHSERGVRRDATNQGQQGDAPFVAQARTVDVEHEHRDNRPEYSEEVDDPHVEDRRRDEVRDELALRVAGRLRGGPPEPRVVERGSRERDHGNPLGHGVTAYERRAGNRDHVEQDAGDPHAAALLDFGGGEKRLWARHNRGDRVERAG
jgi:hypothetical protein